MSTPHETIVFARTVADRTDAEVLDFVTTMPDLLAKSTVNDRVAHSRILHDLARRVRDLNEIARIGCTHVSCLYALRVGLAAGVDISIDGDVWPNSRYARHIDRCPFHQAPELSGVEMISAVNAGARSAFCPKCERGHEGPCTGPEPILTIEVHQGADPATMAAIRRVRAFQKQADAAGYGRPPEEEPTMEDCRLCNGSGQVAVGPWGARPPKATCPECEGRKQVSTSHVYADRNI